MSFHNPEEPFNRFDYNSPWSIVNPTNPNYNPRAVSETHLWMLLALVLILVALFPLTIIYFTVYLLGKVTGWKDDRDTLPCMMRVAVPFLCLGDIVLYACALYLIATGKFEIFRDLKFDAILIGSAPLASFLARLTLDTPLPSSQNTS